MNDQLKLLYEKYWDGFITNVYKATMKDGNPICAYPFLIQATPHYLNAQEVENTLVQIQHLLAI